MLPLPKGRIVFWENKKIIKNIKYLLTHRIHNQMVAPPLACSRAVKQTHHCAYQNHPGAWQTAAAQTHINQAMNNATFRVYRYGPDYPGLPGNIRRQSTITGRVPGTVDVFAPAPTGWGTGRKVGAGGGGGGGAAGGAGGGY